MKNFPILSHLAFVAFALLYVSADVLAGSSNSSRIPSSIVRCQDLLRGQQAAEEGSGKDRFYRDTIKQEGKISRTELRTPQNRATFLRVLLREKKLNFINPELLDLASENPRSSKILERLEAFDFEVPRAAENLHGLLTDLRDIAQENLSWKERFYGLRRNLVGPNRKILLQEATDLVLTKEAVEKYLKETLKAPSQSRLRMRLSAFVNGTFSLVKPIVVASFASWLIDFPVWLHRSRSLETLDGKALEDPRSLWVQRHLWNDLVIDKLRRMTLVAMVLCKAAGFVMGIEGDLSDLGKKAWTDLNRAVVLTEAIATYDSEKPGMESAELAKMMSTPAYSKWVDKYEQEYHQRPDPENNAVDLLMWLAEYRSQESGRR